MRVINAPKALFAMQLQQAICNFLQQGMDIGNSSWIQTVFLTQKAYLETKCMEYQLTSQDKIMWMFALAELTWNWLLFCRKFLKIK